MSESGAGRTLVIVESPAKAKTIGKYLGSNYIVRASMGHVRDLPAKGLGVEVEKGTFAPQYETVKGRYKTISEIRALARDAVEVLLATDPDREGEAIAWHIAAAAGLGRAGQSVRRVEFHEITQNAIKAAIANPRTIDMNLVNAQQARRVLDRLVGYKISPFLWRKVQKSLSAGRVQSVALRVVVEREREIEKFVPREFWTVEADLTRHPFSKKKGDIFRAVLHSKVGKKIEYDKGEEAQGVVATLQGAGWSVAKVNRKEGKRHPSAPFTTSTLQQEASRKLRFPTKKTMQIAQQLYEGVTLGAEGSTGLITYMRTDSTQVAKEAQLAAREVIEKIYGPSFLPPKPPFYAAKAKGAQEAHEAVRPTKPQREPDAIKHFLTSEQFLLYRLIWRRFVASQMAEAILEYTTVDIEAKAKDNEQNVFLFKASGERILFPGFMAVYRESLGDKEGEETEETGENEKGGLPKLDPGDLLDLIKLWAEQHFTQPPPRFGEASLVKTLEELGVGRPSTYATILSTIQDRGYVVKATENKERKFRPTALGKAVCDLLVERFPEIVDVKFTARMEGNLDEVAEGKRAWTPLVAAFYTPMMQQLALADKEVAKVTVPFEDLSQYTSYEPTSTGSKSYGGWKGNKKSKSSFTRSQSNVAPSPAGSKVSSKKSGTTGSKRAAATSPGASTTRPRKPKPSQSTSSVLSLEPSISLPISQPLSTAAETCPLCKKPMIHRKGPFGDFFGCSGYPGCKGTRKISN